MSLTNTDEPRHYMKMTRFTLSSGIFCAGLVLGTLGLATPAEAQSARKKVIWNLSPTKKIE